jgi:hypothetical protein
MVTFRGKTSWGVILMAIWSLHQLKTFRGRTCGIGDVIPSMMKGTFNERERGFD